MGVMQSVGRAMVEAAKATADVAKAVYEHPIIQKAVMPALERLIPQGANELANTLFAGNSYWPGQHPMPMQQANQAESPATNQVESPAEKASNVIDFQEAKEALQTTQAISKEMASMSPEEQKIAENFLKPAKPYDPSEYGRGNTHGNEQERGLER